MQIKKFTFNPFQENTFIIYEKKTKECIIIDPGCYEEEEEEELENFITYNNLNPTKLINTHCHIDHVLGNKFVYEKWNVKFYIHELENKLLKEAENISKIYGFENYKSSPTPDDFINEDDIITLGTEKLNILFTPGHSPGHICLYYQKNNILISGDVIFMNSIGRTDLPGGNYDTLIKSIKTKIFPLPKETKLLCGHGPSTNLDAEQRNNPFLKS